MKTDSILLKNIQLVIQSCWATMSLVGLLAGVGAFFKVRYLFDKAVIDNPVFRLHYRTTSAIFFGSCVLTTAFAFFGKPIDCIGDIADGQKQLVVNTFCWTHGTFTLDRIFNTTNHAHPGVGPEHGKSTTYHAYYQWVPFVLFLQGILFYAPHWLWKNFEGGRIRKMTDGSRGLQIGANGVRKMHCKALFEYLTQTMRCHRQMVLAYVSCEVINFINVVGNIYFIDKFLGGIFLKYGFRAAVGFSNEDQEGRSDSMIITFPRMTKCSFHYYGASGTIQLQDYLCILPLNIINEKIYIFLWFWLVLLSVATGLNLIYRLAVYLSPPLRVYLLRRLTSPSLDSTRSVVKSVPIGDYFLLHLLGKNIEGFHFNGLIDDMATHLSNVPIEVVERRNNFIRQTSEKVADWAAGVHRASFKDDSMSTPVYLPMQDVKS